ncbi:hypothetical protein [Amycolatopsis keratiniphila]|uniref:Uncharacterized protein n=1 Tax=Amycolatopsis keratiniphila subsp. keratiniphila TaxID=227715 RepID=A0A1W2M349_9PSEU|nr:hypothetical protein [Amycolatopsis keratiniphila]ONF73960.1 hypothetical protein AVR91_0204315 [Amycolatopsis keratiniphila subsp. keratiniphila]
MAELTEDERHLIAWARGLAAAAKSNTAHDSAAAGWRYHSVAELLLDVGRLFTPQALPAADLGEMGRCYLNATLYATDHPAVFYAEGLAVRAGCLGISDEHAWCAAGAAALDPTWPDGQVYLGVPVTGAWRHARQQATKCVSLLWGPPVKTLLRDGLPEDALADVGRPLPDEARRIGPAFTL